MYSHIVYRNVPKTILLRLKTFYFSSFTSILSCVFYVYEENYERRTKHGLLKKPRAIT